MKKKSLVTLASLQNLAAVLFLLLAFPMVTTANEVEDSMQETDALENLIPGAAERWTGDFDSMTERRMIRVLVVHNKMSFFLDKGHQRGATHDLFIAFEQFVTQQPPAKAGGFE
jgi:hypothetical protein